MEQLTSKITIVFLVLALGRTVLVLDGVLGFHGCGSLASRTSSYCKRVWFSVGDEDLGAVGGAFARAPHPSGGDRPREHRWVEIPLSA